MKLLIDCNNLGYMAAYVFGNLSYEQKRTGVIYGFLNQVLKLSKMFETNQFVFCWDSRKSYRKLFYPEYKMNRRQDLTEEQTKDLHLAFGQFTQLRKEILPAMGFKNVFMQTGYEADDLIAWISARCPTNYVIASSDSDLWQLLCEERKYGVAIYNLKTKKRFTVVDFHKGWGIYPQQWAMAKSIAGDSSDNIQGVEGVGLITAVKYLLGTLKGKKVMKIVRNEDVVKRNLHLVALPYPGLRPIDVELERDEEFYSLDFMDVFTRYGLNSFLGDRFEEWRESFELIEGRK